MQKHNLTLKGETWGVFYHFQLLGLKKISPQLVSKLYIFSRGHMFHGTWRLCWLYSSRKPDQSEKSGWWAGCQTAHHGSSCLSAASHLPLNICIPRGVTKRHMLACPCFALKAVDKGGRNWEVWPKMKPWANFPSYSIQPKTHLEDNLHFTSVSPASSVPEKGVEETSVQFWES